MLLIIIRLSVFELFSLCNEIFVLTILYLTHRLLHEAQLEILSLQRAVREYILTVDDAYGKQFEEFFVGFEGSFGGMHVTPRSLSARFIGNLVCVEGIVTKCMLLLVDSAGFDSQSCVSSRFPGTT